MGYLYLVIALFAGVTKGLCGKKVSNSVENLNECIFVNLLRAFFCAVVGFAVACIVGEDVFKKGITDEISIYILSAVSMAVFCVCWMFAYKNEAYMFLGIFTMLGTIITCILSLVFYNEKISIFQWAGMLIILFAVFTMSKYNKDIKGNLSLRDMIILISGCLGSAVADFCQKVYVREIGEKATVFNFYTYLIAFVILLFVYSVTKKQKVQNQKAMEKTQILLCFAMAFSLYINSAAKTVAATFLPSAQIYPVLQGANLILSALMAHTLLKEKINLKSIVGIMCAFAGLIVMRI